MCEQKHSKTCSKSNICNRKHIKTNVFSPLWCENIKQMLSHYFGANQRIESKNRLKESNQIIQSMNRINESKQRIESRNRIKEPNQRIESMNRIKETDRHLQ